MGHRGLGLPIPVQLVLTLTFCLSMTSFITWSVVGSVFRTAFAGVAFAAAFLAAFAASKAAKASSAATSLALCTASQGHGGRFASSWSASIIAMSVEYLLRRARARQGRVRVVSRARRATDLLGVVLCQFGDRVSIVHIELLLPAGRAQQLPDLGP